jgi:hypothetical protein
MPLNDRIASQPDAESLLAEAWSTSTKNAVARGYMAGMIDTLMWAGILNEQAYELAYQRYVYGE